ncbi:nucleolar complex protein 4 homolog B-like isoform X2 [Halichondria panicea]|uniref:nucleolar complex protein 4 homolog B-like isoform X2 n=1 Tax=Halichondria panicea TaxID=6063 RepID=UPI00312BB037
MEKTKVVEALARLSTLSQSVIQSEKNSNNLVDLLEYLNCDENVPLLKAAIQTLAKVYSHLVSKHYSWIVPPSVRGAVKANPPRERGSDDLAGQYQKWMRDNYVFGLEKLQELTHHEHKEIQWTALCSLVSLVQVEGHTHQSTLKGYIYPNNLFHSIVSCLLDDDTNRGDLIGQFADEYLHYDDVRYYWLKNIASIISTKVDTMDSASVSDLFVKNCRTALRSVIMPSSEEELVEFLTGTPPGLSSRQQEAADDELEDEEKDEGPPKAKRSKRELKALTVRSLQKHRKQFSDAWLAFLRLPLGPSLRKHMLVSLHSEVIPNLMDPRLLLDFLTYSYDEGGVVGLLALNGLFLLMNQHHLDYPDFYNKLYQLLEPSVFHVKYMQRFFHLLDTFLQSTHLSMYLVAAFAKKIARLSLSAPPNAKNILGQFYCTCLQDLFLSLL